MIQEWNLSLEQAFGSHTSMTLAYVGTKSDHLLNSVNYSTTQLGTNVYFGQYSGQSITLNETNGTSKYNGLQAKLDRKLWKGCSSPRRILFRTPRTTPSGHSLKRVRVPCPRPLPDRSST